MGHRKSGHTCHLAGSPSQSLAILGVTPRSSNQRMILAYISTMDGSSDEMGEQEARMASAGIIRVEPTRTIGREHGCVDRSMASPSTCVGRQIRRLRAL